MSTPDTATYELDPALRLFSVAQAAMLLGCSKVHVYRLIKAGEFPVLDIATPGAGVSKTRIRESDLREYLARSAV